jgi:hypothetical protein
MGKIKGHPRSSGYERHPSDWYVEDTWIVEKLLGAETFTGTVHDPAVGCGTIPEVCRARGLEVTGADLIDRGWPGTVVQDFLADTTQRINIITNPPFNGAAKFMLHAIEHCTGKVAMLARTNFLESKTPYGSLFAIRPPTRVYVSVKRVHCPPGDSDAPRGGGAITYAWYVWHSWLYRGEPRNPETVLRWLP